METKHSCRCCLLRPPDKDMKIPYTRLGKTEIYADMLKECFEIHLTTLSSDGECGICEVCVGRLQDASDFKLQVQRSEAELRTQLQGALCVKEEEPLVKSEMAEYDVEGEVPINQEAKPEVSEDPLPTDGSEVFMEFVLNIENKVSSTMRSGVDQEKTSEIKKEHLDNKCDTCGKHFKHKTKLTHHKSIHLGERYNCQQCNIQFKFKCHLDLHNRRLHVGAKPYSCETCYKKFATNKAFDRHKLIHTEKRYRCGQCNKAFTNPHNLNNHGKTHTGNIQYNCDLCGAEFKTKRALIAHVGRHTGQMNFRCKYCSTKFWDYASLLVHKRIHVDSQIYSCDLCNKVFTLKNTLATHLKTHGRERRYPCEFCTAELATLRSLKRHKLTHTEERAFPCVYCNKKFRFKHNLTSHFLVHTGEKQHCCEICGKRFSRKENLKKHLEIHAEGQRFPCELCTKSYPTKEGLRQHRRTHTKVKAEGRSGSKRQT